MTTSTAPKTSKAAGSSLSGRTALLVLNKQARQVQEDADAVVEALRASGFKLVQPEISSRDDAEKIIRKYAKSVDLIVSAGGDGTLNTVLQGIVGTDLPLGILPLGTANDLAKSLDIPLDLQQACDVIAKAHTRRIDVGCVNGTYFFSEMSIGMSPTVSRVLSKEAKATFGIFAILGRALWILRRMRRFGARVTCDGKEHVLRTAQLTIGNSTNFGGFVTTDDAAIDDRKLDLYSVELRHWWSYVEALWALASHRYDTSRCVFTLHGKKFEIETRRPRPIEADGEIVSMTPAGVKVVPRAVTVFVPENNPREA